MNKKIAVNALAVDHRPSGGRTYILNLLEELTTLAGSEYQFYVLCTARNAHIFQERGIVPNSQLVIFPARFAQPLFRIALEQAFLPIWLWQHNISLLFAVKNVMPLLSTCRTVVAVLSMHLNYEDDRIPSWRRWYGRFILRATAIRANAYVSISEYAGQTYIQKYNVSPEKMFAAPLGFNHQKVQHNDQANHPLDGEYILFVSTLFPHKNVAFLIRVFAQVAKARPSIKLAIVGRDEVGILADLQALVNRLGLTDQVDFMGAVSDQELLCLYQHARVFVFPSLVEGFGLSVLEAMAHRVPVVASNRTSIPQVVGDAGIILDPTDEQTWALAILQLLENDQLRQELALRGQERAKDFTWRRTAEAVLNSFEQVLS